MAYYNVTMIINFHRHNVCCVYLKGESTLLIVKYFLKIEQIEIATPSEVELPIPSFLV